jgi:hypothetical protein
MPLGFDGVADFTAATINKYDRKKWIDISLDLPDYVSWRMVKEHMVYENGGDQLTWDVQVDFNDTYRASGLYDPDVTSDSDSLVQASVPWKKVTANYSYDLDLPGFQSDETTIINLVVQKEHGMQNSIVEGIERDTWNLPTSASDKRVNGIPYWIVKNATTTPGGGLTGGNPSGHAAGAGNIDSDEYDQWRNYAGAYTNVTPDDAISRIKRAMAYTNFTPPDPHPQLGFSKAQRGIYTTYPVVEAMERLAETRNDNLGSDLAKFMGQVTVGRVPVHHVFYLTNTDSTNPIYGINWGTIRPFAKKGAWMRITGPKLAPRQHTVYDVFCDCWWNWRCLDRRTQWVLSTS